MPTDSFSTLDEGKNKGNLLNFFFKVLYKAGGKGLMKDDACQKNDIQQLSSN